MVAGRKPCMSGLVSILRRPGQKGSELTTRRMFLREHVGAVGAAHLSILGSPGMLCGCCIGMCCTYIHLFEIGSLERKAVPRADWFCTESVTYARARLYRVDLLGIGPRVPVEEWGTPRIYGNWSRAPLEEEDNTRGPNCTTGNECRIPRRHWWRV